LSFGAARLAASRKRSAIETYPEEAVRGILPIIPYDQEAATWHAQERARLSKRGRPPSAAEGQIAAISSVNALTVVTENVRDFRRFKDLAVANWSR
jgi:tRNA(fMet)-specific endonuclease VapC